jgi:hypothetical protein
LSSLRTVFCSCNVQYVRFSCILLGSHTANARWYIQYSNKKCPISFTSRFSENNVKSVNISSTTLCYNLHWLQNIVSLLAWYLAEHFSCCIVLVLPQRQPHHSPQKYCTVVRRGELGSHDASAIESVELGDMKT